MASQIINLGRGGPVVQWLTRLTSDSFPGSNPVNAYFLSEPAISALN